jgi:EpsI family protein
MPKGVKYVGTDYVEKLHLPGKVSSWEGKDVSDALNINLGSDLYAFLNKYIAYQYTSRGGRSLMLTVLDAANFHFPNVCLTMSGFDIKELNKVSFDAAGRKVPATLLYADKQSRNQTYLIVYWIVIDKKIVPNWVEQKLKQLYFSLFNVERVGLMVRLDIPIGRNGVKSGLQLAEEFVSELSAAIPRNDADYLFGEL